VIVCIFVYYLMPKCYGASLIFITRHQPITRTAHSPNTELCRYCENGRWLAAACLVVRCYNRRVRFRRQRQLNHISLVLLSLVVWGFCVYLGYSRSSVSVLLSSSLSLMIQSAGVNSLWPH